MNEDYLTGLYNMMYLKNNYDTYVKKNKCAKIIAIDFTKLKYINDNFGHDVGDQCLKLFSSFIKILFPNSILVRRSGDEFIIVTNLSNFVIEEKFKEVNKLIIMERQRRNIPIIFGFNCGVKECEENLEKSLKEADLVMYCAKSRELMIMYFDESIVKNHEHDSEFIKTVENLYNLGETRLFYQPITDLKKNVIKEVYARDECGKSFFHDKLYNLLRINHLFKLIDFSNINLLFEKYHNFINDKVMINIQYHSLLSKEYVFNERFKELISKNKIKTKNIILSINIINYNEDVEDLIMMIRELNNLGVEICLDSCNYDTLSTVMNIVRNVKVKYVKIDKKMWRGNTLNLFDKLAFEKIINLFLEVGLTPIFKRIETEQEFNTLKQFKGSLYSGYYFSTEDELKKDK